MVTRLWVLIVALAFLFMGFHCISAHSFEIAALVHRNVASGLQAAGIGGVIVRTDGRDIILTGRVPSVDIKLKAGELAAAQSGVRTVDNELVVAPDVISVSSVQSKLTKILLNKKIEFEKGKSKLLPSSTPVLVEVLSVLRENPQLSVEIQGHTDNHGSEPENRTLSQARAEAVVGWLVQHGIASDRLKAHGYGPDKPIAPNSTRAGRAQNRRVEIIANS